MPDRGPAAYVAEFVGTMFLVFFITTGVTLFVAQGTQAAQFGSDFVVVGLVHGLTLFMLVQVLGATSGAHLNPAVTAAAFALQKIRPIDAIIYVLVQLSGGVAGALLTRLILEDEGRAGSYGAATVSPLLGGAAAGLLVETLGTFLLVLAVVAVALNPRAVAQWAPLSIGLTLGAVALIAGPLTGASVNPARWFGPALVGREFSDGWLYIVGPLIGSGLAVAFYRFVLEPGELLMGKIPDPAAPVAPEAPGKRTRR